MVSSSLRRVSASLGASRLSCARSSKTAPMPGEACRPSSRERRLLERKRLSMLPWCWPCVR
eukprot:11642530-Alexandrium_andersonii.AAC.1